MVLAAWSLATTPQKFNAQEAISCTLHIETGFCRVSGYRAWSFLGTHICLPCAQRPNTRNSRATLGSRHRCWAVGGEGTVPFLRQDASSLGWKMQRRGRTKSPLPVVLWNF